MVVADLAIVTLCVGFAVICWMNCRDPDTISRPQVFDTKLPGIDEMPIMGQIQKESEVQAAALPLAERTVVEEPVTEIGEIPEFDDSEADESEEIKVECPNCSNHIQVEKKGTMQSITCDSCGFSGELEI